MTVTLDWSEITLRLALTVLGGAVIGLNRGERGHPAGLRTTMLVCLAASVSMIQVNLLLGMSGRRPDSSFVMLDLMRLPLGILSGMGFIGAGAILRREDRIVGITTAATLWFVTVLGLCFGGGQYRLGLASLALAVIVLWGLKWLEAYIPQQRRGALELTVASDGVTDNMVRSILRNAGIRVVSLAVTYDIAAKEREFVCEVHWHATDLGAIEPTFLDDFARLPSVSKIRWNPIG